MESLEFHHPPLAGWRGKCRGEGECKNSPGTSTWGGTDTLRNQGSWVRASPTPGQSHSEPGGPPSSWGRRWAPSCSLTGSLPWGHFPGPRHPPKPGTGSGARKMFTQHSRTGLMGDEMCPMQEGRLGRSWSLADQRAEGPHCRPGCCWV